MSYQARYIGLDEVLEAFHKKAKTPYFSMWMKGQPVCQYTGDDMDEAIELITEEIELNKKRQVTHESELFLHTKKEKQYSRKSDSYAVIGFRSFEINMIGSPADHGGYNTYAMHNELNIIKSQLAALQATAAADPDEDDDEDDDDTMMGSFNKMIEHPLVVGMINKWMAGSATVTALAGVTPSSESLQETINLLFSKGVQLQHLQKLAAMDKDKIQMLINML
mgnify:CR=1 FL=1